MYKKLLCVLALFCFLMLAFNYSKSQFVNYSNDITFYVNAYSSNAIILDKAILHTGESFSFNTGDIDVFSFLEDYQAVICYEEVTETEKNYYAYTNKINNYVVINDKKINLHVNVGESISSIGTPLIFGSF